MEVRSKLSIAAFISAIVFGFCAMWIPPMGIIDNSVLWFTSQLLVFVASLLGVNFNIDGLRHKSSTKVEKR